MRRRRLLTAMILPLLTACAPSRCEVDGVQHKVGDTYPCADGCNTCTCTLTGTFHTDMDCHSDTGGEEDTADTGASAE